MDLTGEIFFIGDLGGEKSNEETIQLRDLIKELTTDGYIERGIVDKNNDMEEEEQWVKGYPALSYTTAKEEMVNDQEKSRSVILTPPPVDSGKLMVFDTVMNYHGKYDSDIKEVLSIRDSIQGLVYKFNPNEFDFFNPYLFTIEDMVKDNDDFNIRNLLFKVRRYNYDEKIDNVFASMQKEHIQMAIVVKDKKFIGVITLEDAVEEILGNIYDEYDE